MVVRACRLLQQAASPLTDDNYKPFSSRDLEEGSLAEILAQSDRRRKASLMSQAVDRECQKGAGRNSHTIT